jgi:hypothetical protein
VKKKLSMLALNIFVVSGCKTVPTMPDIEIGLIDAARAKRHVYMLPKQRGEDGKFLRSESISLNTVNKHYTFSPRNYSLIEQHISTLEDWGVENCR